MNRLDSIIDGLIQREGGYVDDPKDPGGKTIYGITEATARRNGYKGDMAAMPRRMAQEIYLNEYWQVPGFGQVGVLSMAIAEELLDTGVLCGVATSSEFLQRALNAMNFVDGKYLWPDLKRDSQIGPGTLSALKAYLQYRGAKGEEVMLAMLNALQGEYLISVAERRVTSEKFVFGWFSNRVIL